MRTKWHQSKRTRRKRGPKTIEDRASAVGFNIWKIAFAMFKNMEKEKFSFASDEQIIAMLTEVIAFLIQVADRIVYGQLEEDDRHRFVNATAKYLAKSIATNTEGMSLDYDPVERYIETLNARFKDYAELEYTPDGHNYAFLRYFGERVFTAMEGGDNKWAVEHVMEIEAPEALKLLKKNVGEVLGVKV
jgi:hypothetical protein